MRPRLRLVLLLAILLIAVAVRLVGLQFGLPFAYARPDETEAAGPAVQYLTTGSLRPVFFQWPTLYSYLTAALYVLYGGVFGFLTGHASLADFLNSRYQVFAPFLLIPRTFSLTMGVLTVGVLYTVGRRAFDASIGLVASAFLALSFLHVRESHFGMTDVTMTALVMLSTLVTFTWHQREERDEPGGMGRALLAGLLAGLAGSTKYNGLAAVSTFSVAAGLSWLAHHHRRLAITGQLVAYVVAAAVGFFGASPYILREWSRFIADITVVQNTLATGHGGMQISRGWWYFGTVVLPAGVGWPVFLVSLAGLAGLFATRFRQAAVLLAFPIAYYLYAGSSLSVFARYILPAVPFLCLSAAWLVVTLMRRALPTRPEQKQGWAIAAVSGLLIAPSAWASIQLDRLLTQTDNRVVTASALAEVLPADDLIYQSGSSYGRVPLGITGRGAELREVTFDADAGTFSPAEPTWILVQRSPLVMYSRVPDTLTRVLADRYTLVASYPNERPTSAPVARLYDQQDAFYLPLSGFSGLRRPGPSFDLFRRRQ